MIRLSDSIEKDRETIRNFRAAHEHQFASIREIAEIDGPPHK